jgi:hypothetical protein
MAATQQLPSWMTLSTTVYTNAAGQTITSETTLQLPLTYYGPSVSTLLACFHIRFYGYTTEVAIKQMRLG